MANVVKRTRPPKRRPAPRASAPLVDLRPAFAALKALLVKHARHLVVVHDAPDEYYLNTPVAATTARRGVSASASQYRGWPDQ